MYFLNLAPIQRGLSFKQLSVADTLYLTLPANNGGPEKTQN